MIVVANYDSGKVRRDLNGAMPAVLPILYWVELAMLVVMPLLLAIRMVLAPDGTVLVVFNVLPGCRHGDSGFAGCVVSA